MDEYRAYLTRQGLAPDTVAAYVNVVERLARWAGKPAEELTADDAAAWIHHRPGLSQATRNTYHRWLSAWCAYTGADLLDGVRRPPAPQHRPKPVAAGQVFAMLAACRNEREKAMVLLAFYAGLRRAEIAGFRGEQVDPWRRTLHVQGKGGKDAEVPVAPIQLRHARVMPARGYWVPSPRRPGEHVAPFTIWSSITRISQAAGCGHVPPHRLRHAFATEMVRGGEPLTTVRVAMRHSRIATTAAYVAVTDEDLATAVARLPGAA